MSRLPLSCGGPVESVGTGGFGAQPTAQMAPSPRSFASAPEGPLATRLGPEGDGRQSRNGKARVACSWSGTPGPQRGGGEPRRRCRCRCISDDRMKSFVLATPGSSDHAGQSWRSKHSQPFSRSWPRGPPRAKGGSMTLVHLVFRQLRKTRAGGQPPAGLTKSHTPCQCSTAPVSVPP